MFDWLGPYQFVVDVTLITVILTTSLFVVFQSGLLALSSVGFMAVGGYTSSLLVVKLSWPVFPAVVIGSLVAGLIALAFGLVVLRLRGIYFALGTLALAQAVVVGIANFEFTNGARGISGIPIPVTTLHLLLVLVVLAVVFQLIHRSHVGRALRALRLDERTAEGLGVNTLRYKIAVYTASGLIAGLAGALEAHRTGVVSPEQYSFGLLVLVLTYAMVGGNVHWAGPMAAALGIGLFRQYMSWSGTFWENLIYGALLVVLMVVAPNGLVDRKLYQGLRRRRAAAPQPAPAQSGTLAAHAETATAASDQAEHATVLSVTGVAKTFGGVVAVDGVSFDVRRGLVFGLIGPNGAGKTTLVNLITGYMSPNQGSITFGGTDVLGLRPYRLAAAGVARTYQNLRLFDEYTVLENVLIGRHLAFKGSLWRLGLGRQAEQRAQLEKANDLIARLGLQHVAGLVVGSLPYGLRRRVEIARALATEPSLLLLDEPTAGMTRAESDEIGALIRSINDQGITVILVEHNVRLVSAICDRVAVLDRGKLIATGSPGEVWAHELVQSAYLGHKRISPAEGGN